MQEVAIGMIEAHLLYDTCRGGCWKARYDGSVRGARIRSEQAAGASVRWLAAVAF
jgi:hypothetical protein